MAAIVTVLGRATKDPEMQQAKDSGNNYISLDLATTQRQDGKEETIYFQCFFNAFLAERLSKANVKKGTGLMIYGDLEAHPFMYKQGRNAGQPGINLKVMVKDWHFVPSNRSDNNAGNGSSNASAGQNGYGQSNGGAATPGAGAAPNQGSPAPNNGGYQNQGMQGNGGYQQSGYTPNSGGYPANNGAYQPAPNGNMANGYAPQGNYGTPAGNHQNDGFTNVPEYAAGQLPFS